MTNGKPDGGSAFPVHDGTTTVYGGMSLREWFAGMALQGIITRGTDANSHDELIKQTVAAAYIFADAMIAEGEK